MTVSLSVSLVTFAPPLIPAFESVLHHLQEAILDAQRNSLLDNATITVIDNGNNQSILEGVLEKTTDNIPVSLILKQKNVGYSAHNQAIKSADSDYHLILNPDVLLSITSLSAGLDYMNNCQETVMVCPYSEGQQGKPSYLCKRYPAVFDLALRGFANSSIKQRFDDRLKQYEYRDLPTAETLKSVELISGCCMLARTGALKSSKGFDEKFFLYFEDFDLSLRMSKLGNLDYYPDMKIIHYGGNAASKGFQHILYFLKSAIRFYRKHGLRIV